jgi:hypothetical protein
VPAPLTENELWLLSFYRTSEISGALLFGRLARSMRPGPVQMDMTQHFADEAQHAAHWTNCLRQLGAEPLKLSVSYQDQYLEAAGLPMNLMEVLSITQVFEQRVLNQYTRHLHAPLGNRPEVDATLRRIMGDEKWHVKWVRDALASMEGTYGTARVQATLKRHRAADRLVYDKTRAEHEDRLRFLFATAAAS